MKKQETENNFYLRTKNSVSKIDILPDQQNDQISDNVVYRAGPGFDDVCLLDI